MTWDSVPNGYLMPSQVCNMATGATLHIDAETPEVDCCKSMRYLSA